MVQFAGSSRTRQLSRHCCDNWSCHQRLRSSVVARGPVLSSARLSGSAAPLDMQSRHGRPGSAMTNLVRRESELLLYQTEDGRTRVEVRFDGETAWLSLRQMAKLFQRDKSVISRHIKNVFEEGELDRPPPSLPPLLVAAHPPRPHRPSPSASHPFTAPKCRNPLSSRFGGSCQPPGLPGLRRATFGSSSRTRTRCLAMLLTTSRPAPPPLVALQDRVPQNWKRLPSATSSGLQLKDSHRLPRDAPHHLVSCTAAPRRSPGLGP
jgi:hypothetical protein